MGSEVHKMKTRKNHLHRSVLWLEEDGEEIWDVMRTWTLWWISPLVRLNVSRQTFTRRPCCSRPFPHLFKAAVKTVLSLNYSASVVIHGVTSSFAVQDIGPIGPDRNWKGIGISLLVILVVLSLIGLSIVLLSKGTYLYFYPNPS